MDKVLITFTDPAGNVHYKDEMADFSSLFDYADLVAGGTLQKLSDVAVGTVKLPDLPFDEPPTEDTPRIIGTNPVGKKGR